MNEMNNATLLFLHNGFLTMNRRTGRQAGQQKPNNHPGSSQRNDPFKPIDLTGLYRCVKT
jgi:hypothetical protein